MDDEQTSNQPVIEAEIVTNDGESQEPTPVDSLATDQTMSPAALVIELEQVIKNHISGLTARRDQLKKLKEMVSDAFKNDATYEEAEAHLKEATKIKKDVKSKLMKQPGVSEAAEKVKDLSGEIKELDGALSDYLREYQRLSGSNEIEDDEGNVHEIVYLAKLLKKGSKK